MLREIIGTILFIFVPLLIIYIPYKIYEHFFFKHCPYCRESINKKAIKCKYCHSDLRGK